MSRESDMNSLSELPAGHHKGDHQGRELYRSPAGLGDLVGRLEAEEGLAPERCPGV